MMNELSSERGILLSKRQSSSMHSNLRQIDLKDYIPTINNEDLNNNNNNNISNEESFSQFKRLQKCTYFQFGAFPCFQKAYYCETCDPNNTEKLCHECFIKCHHSCSNNDSQENESLNNAKNNKLLIIDDDINKTKDNYCSFICDCGKKRHILNKKITSINASPCLFLELDIKLRNKAEYSCETCNIKPLCYICYIKCHGSKYNCITKKKLTTNEYINENKKCKCQHSNHCSRILLNKFMNNIFQSANNYDTIPFIWKCQILNCAFDGSIYKHLYESVYMFILNFQNDYFDINSIDETMIDTLSRFVINITKTKRFYYLHDNLIKVIPLNKLIQIIKCFNQQSLIYFKQFAPFISGLLTLLLVLHLKRDFQHIKAFCYKDFLIINCLDRIKMRHSFKVKSLYTKGVIEKYYEHNEMMQYCIDFMKMVIVAMKAFDIKEMYNKEESEKFINNYVIVFKIVYFCIKRFMFDKNGLLELIDVMEQFCNRFNIIINAMLSNKNINEDNDHHHNLETVAKIVSYLSKINYIIAISYNDFIIEEYLINNSISEFYNEHLLLMQIISNQQQYNTKHKNVVYSKFLHYKNAYSKKLFKIITSTSLIYNTVLLDEYSSSVLPINFELINYVNQTLELFTLSDNLYYQHLNKLTINDINTFKRYELKLRRRQFEENELHFKFTNDNIIDIDRSNMNQYDLSEVMLISCYNTYKHIECKLKLFFEAKINYEQLDISFYEILISFAKEWTHDNLKLKNENNLSQSSSQHIPTSHISYIQLLSNHTKELFSIITTETLLNPLKLQIIVDELIYSNIDITLTKLFLLDPIMKRYSLRSIQTIFNFLMFYLYTKEGVMHLITGRNLNRIITIFKVFPKETLCFLSFIARAINEFAIDIVHHKQIPILLKDVYEFIKEHINEEFIKNNTNDIRECIVYTMEMLYFLTHNFEIECLNKMSLLIIEQLQKLLSRNKIISMFPFYSLFEQYARNVNIEIKNNSINNPNHHEYGNKNNDNNFSNGSSSQNNENDNNTQNSNINNSFNDEINGEDLFIHNNEQIIPELPFYIKEDETYELDYIKTLFNKNKNKSFTFSSLQRNIPPYKRLQYILEKNLNYHSPELKSQTNNISKSKIYLEGIKPHISVDSSLNDSIMDNQLNNSNINSNNNNNEQNNDVSSSSISNDILESKSLLNDQKFFFSLIKLLSTITHFFLVKNNTLNVFNEINDILFYKHLLQNNYLSLTNRTTLLVFLRMIYINDQIAENNSLILKKYMNSPEYVNALSKLRLLTNNSNCTRLINSINQIETDSDIKKEALNELISINAFERFENIFNLRNMIEIIVHEIENVYYYLFADKDDINAINNHVKELLFTMKLISDLFLIYELSSHMTLWLYEMTKAFLNKLKFFISFLNAKDINDIFIKEEYSNINVSEMEKKTFNIYNTERIYGFILEGFQYIYDNTNFNEKFKLKTFISNYMQKEDKNFRYFTLNKIEIPFYAFVDCDSQDNSLTNCNNNNFYMKVFIEMKKEYLNQFNNFFNTAFYDLICYSSYEMALNYNEIFLNYCIVYLFNLKNFPNDNNLVTFVTMLNKLLMYEPIATQKALNVIFTKKNKVNTSLVSKTSNKVYYEEQFFLNLSKLLQEKININITTCKNIVIPSIYEQINISTKILIQFFQLLGEGHNKVFHDLIISGHLSNKSNHSTSTIIQIINNNDTSSLTIFQILIQTLGYIIKCFDSYSNLLIKGELPFDKLIIMTKNIIDFIIEYFQGTTIEKYKIMYNDLKGIFPQIKSFMFYNYGNILYDNNIEYSNINNVEDTNIQNTSLNETLSSSIHSNQFQKESSFIFTVKRNGIYTIKILLLELISSLIEEGNADNIYLNTINEIIEIFSPIELYDDAVNSFEYFILNDNKTSSSLKHYSLENENIILKLIELYKYDANFQTSIELKWALKVYYYIRVLSDVYERTEVKSFLDNLQRVYNEIELNENKEINSTSFSKTMSYINNKSTTFNNNYNSNSIIKAKITKTKIEKVNYVVLKFLSQLLTRIEIREINNESNRDYSFFIIPPICFLLSNQTITNFNKYVDRDSVHSKIISLINETDYFIYEMFYNEHYYSNCSSLSKTLSQINIQLFERINYAFIILHNVFLLIHFFSKEEIHPSIKNTRNIFNSILSIIHLVFIIIILFIWFYYTFYLEYVHNIMNECGVKFIFRKNTDKFSHFSMLSESSALLLNKVAEQITLKDKIKIILIDSIISNRRVNMFIATFICVGLYLITGNAIPLALPVLFLANMIELLYGIFLTVKLRWSQLLLVLTYTYLIVYIFSVLSFYYFIDSFTFDDVYDVKNDALISEPVCSSMLQCYMSLLNYGVRSGGGIADIIIKLSYSSNIGNYVSRFFFDILFHIIILLIMTNLIFGIIVDSFADLRNKNNELVYDKENVCFICQMTRDDAMNKNIDFDNHRNTVHNLWNYVYFLTYLHINNQNNFKMLESAVWNKIHKMDTSWIPTNEKEEGKENENDDYNEKENEINIENHNKEKCENNVDINIQGRFQNVQLKVIVLMLNEVINGYDVCNLYNNMFDNFTSINDNNNIAISTWKDKMKLWKSQGENKQILIINDSNKLNSILLNCEQNKFNTIKLYDKSNSNIIVLIIGPESEQLLNSIIV